MQMRPRDIEDFYIDEIHGLFEGFRELYGDTQKVGKMEPYHKAAIERLKRLKRLRK